MWIRICYCPSQTQFICRTNRGPLFVLRRVGTCGLPPVAAVPATVSFLFECYRRPPKAIERRTCTCPIAQALDWGDRREEQAPPLQTTDDGHATTSSLVDQVRRATHRGRECSGPHVVSAGFKRDWGDPFPSSRSQTVWRLTTLAGMIVWILSTVYSRSKCFPVFDWTTSRHRPNFARQW